MFPNLEAEQARHNHTNADVAMALGMSRNSYETKKKGGRFSIADANALCDLYQCSYSYLFSETPLGPQTWHAMA